MEHIFVEGWASAWSKADAQSIPGKRVRILIVSQYYPPENVLIPRTLAQHLANAGHDVRVLTGFPNYPTGKIYPGFRQRWRTTEEDGLVRILRVPIYMNHATQPLKRILNYTSFSLSATTARQFSREADVIYVYATQMTAAFAPWLWSYIGGAPYLLHIQDLWPDSVIGSSFVGQRVVGRFANAVLVPWLAGVYGRSAAIIGIAPTMVERLNTRPTALGKSHLVYNWAEDGSRMEVARTDGPSFTSKKAGSTHILYAGNIGDMQDVDSFIIAAHHCQDVGIVLTIVGDGTQLTHVRALVNRLKSENIHIYGRVPVTEMKKFYLRADFALVTLKKLPVFEGTIPSKFQASLARGLPVISTVLGDVSDLVGEFSLGFTAEPENASSLEEAMRKAAATTPFERQVMSSKAIDLYTEMFSPAKGLAAIEKLLETVAAKSGAKLYCRLSFNHR